MKEFIAYFQGATSEPMELDEAHKWLARKMCPCGPTLDEMKRDYIGGTRWHWVFEYGFVRGEIRQMDMLPKF